MLLEEYVRLILCESQELEEAGKLKKGLTALALTAGISQFPFVDIELEKPEVSTKFSPKSKFNQTFFTKKKEKSGSAEQISRKEILNLIKKASKKYNVPISLVYAVVKTESNFNPKAVSNKNAKGLMQLVQKTADGLGVQDPFNPEENIFAGTKYLAYLLRRFNNDIELALAAYNAGEGNVRKYQGIPPFEETQRYVKKVIEHMNNSPI